jgi:hypothetical protein
LLPPNGNAIRDCRAAFMSPLFAKPQPFLEKGLLRFQVGQPNRPPQMVASRLEPLLSRLELPQYRVQ